MIIKKIGSITYINVELINIKTKNREWHRQETEDYTIRWLVTTIIGSTKCNRVKNYIEH